MTRMPVSLLAAILAIASVCLLASGIVRGNRRRSVAGIVGVLGTLLCIVTLGASFSTM